MPRVRSIVRRMLPAATADQIARSLNSHREYKRLKLEWKELRERCGSCGSLDERIAAVLENKPFGAIQLHPEIGALLQLLAKEPPTHVCEIGSASGGTLFLFTRVATPDALVICVDLELAPERARVYRQFAKPEQRIVPIRGDSHSAETVQQVRFVLNGELLDFLFIDGDHSYAGVKADFENYGKLVRRGGLIVFHDIVADFNSRYGKQTGHYTGGVPQFWQEVKQGRKTTEFVEDPEQDGFGIGVIFC